MPGPSGGRAGDRAEWLWLLHDDCEPAPDALEQLLRGAAETGSAAVLGPKLKDWTNRDVILEAGVTLDTAARRVTGIEPREVDQGQHDGDRDALAVSSAGMLVRRDVWDEVGGFDVGMGLFMDDIDFCWRVHAAGYRVRVITDAVVFHVQAAAKHRRAVSVGRRARMLDRRNGAADPARQPAAAARCCRRSSATWPSRCCGSASSCWPSGSSAAHGRGGRAGCAVLGHPLRLVSDAARPGRRPPGRLRPGQRRPAAWALGTAAGRVRRGHASAASQTDTAGSHHAIGDPTEDDPC